MESAMTISDPQPNFDAVIVGAGAGGCAAAYNLARAGLRVVVLEKGGVLPRDASTLDIGTVVKEGRFKSREAWLDGEGRPLQPEEYFNLGGKTKWYGAALLRYGAHEFAADAGHECQAWPIGYETLAPYYEQAEALLGVRRFACEPGLRRIVDALARRAPGWRAEPLPMGLAGDIVNHPDEARHFDGFASPADLKGDAETAFLNRVKALPNLSILTGVVVSSLVAAPAAPTRITGVQLADGSTVSGRTVLLAAGALHSPRLLQRFVAERQLATAVPCHEAIGRHLKLHLLTAVVAISPRRQNDLIRKTALLLDDSLPHSSVQPLGFDGELIGTLIPSFVPRFVARSIGARAYGFFLQTEDGAHRDNRVLDAALADRGLPVLDYDARRSPAAAAEHARLVRRFRASLARIGFVAFAQPIGLAGTAHVSGTLTAGQDPARSVVDAQGKVHGLDGLYVVDGSVLPRSSRVNPSLTIYAWSLRVAELLAGQLASMAADRRQTQTA
jgi:choline dehydrogenase-like flavoprotein